MSDGILIADHEVAPAAYEPADAAGVTVVAPVASIGPTTWRRRAAWIIRRPGLILAVLFILVMLGWAFAPSWFTSQNPLVGVPRHRLQAPSAAHWFGTDHLGRDVYTRVVYGAALSLKAVVIAIAIGLVVGTTIGLLAGYFGGRVDDVFMRGVDVLMAIPALLLALAVVTVLGFGTVNVAIAVGVASVARMARVMRSEVLRARTELFVEAAVASGVRRHRVLLRHVLPNSFGAVLTLAALEFGTAILAISALSFLGFGAAPPQPEWGSLVADGRSYLSNAWWLTTLPSVIVVFTVLAANRISRALARDEWSIVR